MIYSALRTVVINIVVSPSYRAFDLIQSVTTCVKICYIQGSPKWSCSTIYTVPANTEFIIIIFNKIDRICDAFIRLSAL